VREVRSPNHARPPSPYPSPAGGFAQKFKTENKIDDTISSKIQYISPKPTFCAKPPQGEGINRFSQSRLGCLVAMLRETQEDRYADVPSQPV
jgi:hypothetical protein